MATAAPTGAIELTYKRQVFERLFETFGDASLADFFEVRDSGVYPGQAAVEELLWSPACELQDQRGGLDPLSDPGLPFPFTAMQFAAWLVDGVGWFVKEAILERDSTLNHVDNLRAALEHLGGIRAGKAREVLDDACMAYLQAETLSGAEVHAPREARQAWRRAMVQSLLATHQVDASIAAALEESGTKQSAGDKHAKVIMAKLSDLGHDPKRLPRTGQRKGSPVKGKVRSAVVDCRPQVMTFDQFTRTWKTLHRSGEIAEE